MFFTLDIQELNNPNTAEDRKNVNVFNIAIILKLVGDMINSNNNNSDVIKVNDDVCKKMKGKAEYSLVQYKKTN